MGIYIYRNNMQKITMIVYVRLGQACVRLGLELLHVTADMNNLFMCTYYISFMSRNMELALQMSLKASFSPTFEVIWFSRTDSVSLMGPYCRPSSPPPLLRNDGFYNNFDIPNLYIIKGTSSANTMEALKLKGFHHQLSGAL